MSDTPLVINGLNKEYYKNPNFYALGQYSKFIAPDSVRVGVKANKTQNNFGFAAFERPDKSVAVIVFNVGDKPIDVVISDANNGKVVNKIDGQTIQSYIYWNWGG